MAIDISTDENPIAKAPQTYTCMAKDVSLSYVQTDSITRLQEDIEKIPTVEEPKFDWFSCLIGIIPSMIIGLLCEWDISSRNSIIYLVALVVAAIAAIYCAYRRGKDSGSIKIANERISTVRTDLYYILKQREQVHNSED